MQDPLRWPVSANRRDDSARLGDDADAKPQVSALVTTPTVVCISMGFAGVANEVVPRISIVPTVREYITGNGFVGFADLRQPGDDSSFLLAGQQCVGLPPLGAPLGPSNTGCRFSSRRRLLESVAALGAGRGAHASPLRQVERQRGADGCG